MASKTIYLDFTGHTVPTGPWVTAPLGLPAFTTDVSETFTESELTIIQHTWARVAELFSPFEVNVTTKEPAVSDLVYAGVGDSRWGMRVVISGSSVPDGAGAGGVAFLGSFQSDTDISCFVNTSGSGTSAAGMALVAAHEVGHTLGLDHHGTSAEEYFDGQGSGVTSWGPIMGAPYGRALMQWTKPVYALADNVSQDDLATITDNARNFRYRVDDRANTFSRATRLTRPLGMSSLRSTGIIERNTDTDVFSFTVQSGLTTVQVRPFDTLSSATFAGASLDVGAILYSSDGRVVADMRPENRLDAQFSGVLPGGTYFVRVFGTGNADPLVDGYNNYGSLGQYSVNVSQSSSAVPQVSITAPQPMAEGGSRIATMRFQVTLSSASAAEVTVNYATRDGSAMVFDNDYLAATGTLVFAPGETRKTIPVSVLGDTRAESNEMFSIELTTPVNAILGRGEATAVIVNDDRITTAPVHASIYGPSATVSEGVAATFMIVLSEPATVPVQVGYRTASGTAIAGRDFSNSVGFVTFAPGETSQTFSVTTHNDTVAESDESFAAYLVRRPGPVQVSLAPGIATIGFNDGGLPKSLSGSSGMQTPSSTRARPDAIVRAAAFAAEGNAVARSSTIRVRSPYSLRAS